MLESYLNRIQETTEPTYCITIECTSQAAKETLLPLLEYLKRTAAIGHSFTIVVNPGDSDYEKEFGMDGDGAAHITSIKYEVIEKT